LKSLARKVRLSETDALEPQALEEEHRRIDGLQALAMALGVEPARDGAGMLTDGGGCPDLVSVSRLRIGRGTRCAPELV